MSTPEGNPLHRLYDMLVQEVSLVDRAANKRRFLIVKRDQTMSTDDNTNDPSNTDTSHECEANDTGETPAANKDDDTPNGEADDDDETFVDDGSPLWGPDSDEANSSPLQLTAAALDSLSEAVSMLGGDPSGSTETQLTALASELQTMASNLISTLPTPKPTDEDKSTSPSEPTTKQVPAQVDQSVAALRQLIEQLRAMLMRYGAQPQSPATKQRKPKGESQPLNELTNQVAKLVKVVQTQQGQLRQLEKRFGLPNSLPVDTTQFHSATGDGDGWPLDMNRELNRTNVDSGVSFHDLK